MGELYYFEKNERVSPQQKGSFTKIIPKKEKNPRKRQSLKKKVYF